MLFHVLSLVGVLPALPGDPPDWATLFAGVGTGINDTITAVLPIAIPVLVVLASISIALAVFRKVGVKR